MTFANLRCVMFGNRHNSCKTRMHNSRLQDLANISQFGHFFSKTKWKYFSLYGHSISNEYRWWWMKIGKKRKWPKGCFWLEYGTCKSTELPAHKMCTRSQFSKISKLQKLYINKFVTFSFVVVNIFLSVTSFYFTYFFIFSL